MIPMRFWSKTKDTKKHAKPEEYESMIHRWQLLHKRSQILGFRLIFWYIFLSGTARNKAIHKQSNFWHFACYFVVKRAGSKNLGCIKIWFSITASRKVNFSNEYEPYFVKLQITSYVVKNFYWFFCKLVRANVFSEK